jgi:hypothetical protein
MRSTGWCRELHGAVGKEGKAYQMMTVELKELEGKSKNLLAELNIKEAQLKQELQAIELVQQTAGLPETTDLTVPIIEDAV